MTLSCRIGALTLTLAGPALLSAGCEKETRDTDIKLVSVGEVKSLWDRQKEAEGRGGRNIMVLLDSRPEKDFKASHIDGARNLRLPQVDPKGVRDPGLERFDNIVVYGDDPGSATARGMVKRLLFVGYEHIRFFAGGLKEWKARGLPTVDAAPPPEAPPAPATGEAPPGPGPK
jgi:3-mercaptopyruvate sulfurtransferase SseA